MMANATRTARRDRTTVLTGSGSIGLSAKPSGKPETGRRASTRWRPSWPKPLRYPRRRYTATCGITNHPSNTDIIRSYGAVLAGDEEAFLLPSKAAVRRSSTPPERLRQWRERERAWLEYEIASMKDIYEDDALRIILEVFSALWDILSLYEISDGYNYRPDTGSLEGAEEYFETLLEDLRERWGIGRWGSISELLRSSIGFYIADKLGYIIYETEVFVKSYSVPGVSRRWREINPHLNYYDPVFDLLEELPPKEFEVFRDLYSYHPTQRDIQLRRLYFSTLEGREDGADMAYFQEELLDTLVRVFKKDFVWG